MRIYVLNFKLMKRVCSLVLLFALLLFMVSFSAATAVAYIADSQSVATSNIPAKIDTVIIDAGHGGEDPGATGVNGKYEKDLNLELALCLGEELSSKGYTVIYTRTEDKMLYSPEENIKGMRKLSDLKNRCKIAENYENAIFVSIHMNTFGASKYSGLQVYYSDGNDESYALASSIQQSVKNEVQNENTRVVKNGKDIYLLENCSRLSVLIECGFLSNAEECEKLSEKEYQKQLSFAISCGIIDYIEKTGN